MQRVTILVLAVKSAQFQISHALTQVTHSYVLCSKAQNDLTNSCYDIEGFRIVNVMYSLV